MHRQIAELEQRMVKSIIGHLTTIVLSCIYFIDLPWSSILFLLILFPLGSLFCCGIPKIPLILYDPGLCSAGNCVAGAWAITDTKPEPPVDPVPPPPLLACCAWCTCFAFSAALFRTILQEKQIIKSKQKNYCSIQ